MSQHQLVLTGSLARAARALTETSVAVTASTAGLAEAQLRDFERGRGALDERQIAALVSALESLGAFFIPDGKSGRGHGVRLKFTAWKARRVESWEDEGGRPAEDDV